MRSPAGRPARDPSAARGSTRASSGPMPGGGGDLVRRRPRQAGERAEPLQQGLLPVRTDAGHLVQAARPGPVARASGGGRRPRTGGPRRGGAAGRTAPPIPGRSPAAAAGRADRPPPAVWRAPPRGMCRPASARTVVATESWPRPPSTTISAGGYANRRRRGSVSSASRVRRANRRRSTSSMLAKSSWPGDALDLEPPVVATAWAARPRTRPSSRPCRSVRGWRCRSTRSAAALAAARATDPSSARARDRAPKSEARRSLWRRKARARSA